MSLQAQWKYADLPEKLIVLASGPVDVSNPNPTKELILPKYDYINLVKNTSCNQYIISSNISFGT